MSDYISRQAAIDALKRISFSHWFECGEYLSEDTREIEIINSNKALEVIEALPSAQPERKTGRWIYKKDLKQFFCDQCGEPSLTEDDRYIYSMDFSNFCPNCGARMEG